MGVERFEDGAEEPAQNADTGPPKDTGSPRDARSPQDADRSGDADRSRDPDRSGEPAQSPDVDRPEDPAPETPPRGSPERADVKEERAEPRTRSEYADHIAPPGTPPIEEHSPRNGAEEPSSTEDEYSAAMPSGQRHAEESHSAQEPDQQRAEEHWDEEQPHPGNDSTAPREAQPSPDDPAIEPPQQDSESTPPRDDPEEARNHVETDSGLNVSWEADNDPGRDPDDTREPTTVDDLVSLKAESPSTQELDRGSGIGPDFTLSSESNEENPTEGAPATEDPDQAASEVDEPRHPLTDKEWAEHLTEVRRTLDRAREEGLESHLVYTIDPDHQSWIKERRELHNSIINDFYSAARDVPNTGSALVAGGLGGAGKTTVLTEQAGIDTSQYLIINPDNLKVEMARRGMTPEIEGLSPMEASDLVHEESSYLARQLALRAYSDRRNVIWDITMSDEKRTAARLNEMRNAGYTRIDGLFVDIPVETSVERTESRHREGHEKFLAGNGLGGRPVPPKIIRDQEDPEWGSKNRRTFNNLKSRFDNWSIYDNSVDRRSAIIIDSSKRNHTG